MAKKMTTKASSRQWPLHVFYNILDLSGINSYILFTEVTGEKISRRKFLLRLAEELCEMVTEQKVSNSTTSKKVNKKRKTCFASKCDEKQIINVFSVRNSFVENIQQILYYVVIVYD